MSSMTQYPVSRISDKFVTFIETSNRSTFHYIGGNVALDCLLAKQFTDYKECVKVRCKGKSWISLNAWLKLVSWTSDKYLLTSQTRMRTTVYFCLLISQSSQNILKKQSLWLSSLLKAKLSTEFRPGYFWHY